MPAAQVEWSETSGTGAFGWVDSQCQPVRNFLEDIQEEVRRETSEGLPSLTVVVNLNAERTRRVSGGGGYHERVGTGGGRGTGCLYREDFRRVSEGSDFKVCGRGGV